MVRVTAVHLEGGHRREHIASVQWVNPQRNDHGQSTRAEMVTWLRQPGSAIVSDTNRTVDVGVVDATPPCIRTYADGVWTDNLLALPRY